MRLVSVDSDLIDLRNWEPDDNNFVADVVLTINYDQNEDPNAGDLFYVLVASYKWFSQNKQSIDRSKKVILMDTFSYSELVALINDILEKCEQTNDQLSYLQRHFRWEYADMK